jgi:hypothetical protein
MQQGRVTLEADWNEAQQITQEEIRREALDFVGPCGTPDNGYSIVLTPPSTTPPYDFSVDGGTMYVGGMRTYLSGSVQYGNQPDWRDYGPEDPDWVDPGTLANSPPVNEFVYLYLREQEIGAVEDSDLKDVALGGPDTAQRTRLLQHIVRIASPGTDCVSGLNAAETQWQTEGLYLDPNDMRLRSWNTLEVGFSDQTQTPNPCQPQAVGGYLGPDNQLIRVQIATNDATNGLQLVWGFDDASFLYRVEVDSGNSQQLDFQNFPVDAEHQPASNQAVEVLRTAADLPNGATVAATSGLVFTLSQNYNTDSQSIQLPAGVSLPADYTSPQTPPSQLFLRVWQQEITFTPGQAVPLGNTGVTVTLQTAASENFHVGDYWLFAVRTATPQTVYPERYQNGAQPADGPRLWACPLGVISWSGQTGTLAADCRNIFDNLVDLTKRPSGCCTITLEPQDLTGDTTLQSIVDQAGTLTMYVTAANAGAPGNDIAVQISNVQLNATPRVFDLTVTETNIYTGLTTANIQSAVGDETNGTGLVHVIANSIKSSNAVANQQSTLTGGAAEAKAQMSVVDTKSNAVFTLQARNPGTDGNVTQVTISNATTSGFDLTATWTRTLPAVSLGNLFSSILASLAYEITASAPVTSAPAFPTPGVTMLAGGADANANAGTTASAAQGRIFGNPTRICLKPGSYLLSSPLVFLPAQSNITIEACGGPATIGAVPGQEKNFLYGLIVLNGASGVTFRGLIFDMPQFSFFQAGGNLAGLNADQFNSLGEESLFSLNSSLGMLVLGCQNLTVADCTFSFPGLQLNEVMFAAGILASGDCSGVNLKGNDFQGPASVRTLTDSSGEDFSVALAAGFILSDTVQLSGQASEGLPTSGTYLPSSLDNVSVCNNTFESLAFPVIIAAQLGFATFDSNVVTSSVTGFTIVPLAALAQATDSQAPTEANAVSLASTRSLLGNSSLQLMLSVSAAYPRPGSLVPYRQFQVTPALTAVTEKAAPALRVKPASSLVLETTDLQPITAATTGLINRVPVTVFEQAPLLFFRIRFTGNQIDALVTGGASAWALAIMSVSQTTTAVGMLTLTGNQLRNQSEVFTALAMVDFCAATGNIIVNMSASGRDTRGIEWASLIVTNYALSNTSNAAVTGNVFEGPADLPAHTPAWTTLNMIVA